MTEHGWLTGVCEACGRTFFHKPRKTHPTRCAWRSCGEGNAFLALPKRKRLLTTADALATMRKHFATAGFSLVEPLNVGLPASGTTDLVVAGVQVLNGVIHQGGTAQGERIAVIQPCVRTQFQPHVQEREGTSTAFVNVCTECVYATPEEHMQRVDEWCTLLSNLGLHMHDFTVVLRTSEKNWGTGAFPSCELFFSYCGLELGDAMFSRIPRVGLDVLSLSDIGFGLERVVWAINKTASYFDMHLPWMAQGSREMFDACRTLALLALCDVRASNKGSGLQYRRFAKLLSEGWYCEDMYHAFARYFAYWSDFLEPSTELAMALQRVRLEVERFVNIRICNALSLPTPRSGETTEEYCSRLVYTHGIDIQRLRNAIHPCNKH
jgi:hypothetical protein